MKYRREIDGLRAIAVVPVILYHANFSWFSGGFVGVDVFFVISGYLITSILIEEIETDNFSILKFYERRARRILPALFFVVLCCIPFAYKWMLSPQFLEFSQSLIAVALFASNFFFWLKHDYFAPDSDESPLLHTWSLAVEEQFYILFPLFLILIWRYGKKPAFYGTLIITALSLAYAQVSSNVRPEANFYLLPNRAWELGAGAVCAFILQTSPRDGNNPLALCGLFLISVSVFVFDSSVPTPSVFTLVPVAGAALIILYASKETVVAKLLSTGPFVAIGLISYSAYLWHQPLFAFARIRSLHDPSWQLMAVLSVASLALAFLSWKYIEQPFRGRDVRYVISRPMVFGSSAIVGALIIVTGIYGQFIAGNADELTMPESLRADLYDRQFQEDCFDFSHKRIKQSGAFCLQGDPAATPEVAIVGDSHSLSFLGPLAAAFNERGKSFLYSGVSSCPPLQNTFLQNDKRTRESCNIRNSIAFDELVERDITKVVLIARWTTYSVSDFKGSFNYIGANYDVPRDRANSLTVFITQLERTLDQLNQAGIEAVIFHQPPLQEKDARSFYNWALQFSEKNFNEAVETASVSRELHELRYAEFLELMEAKINKFNNSKTISFDDVLCSSGKCLIGTKDTSYYLDDDHLSNAGAGLVVAPFLSELL